MRLKIRHDSANERVRIAALIARRRVGIDDNILIALADYANNPVISRREKRKSRASQQRSGGAQRQRTHTRGVQTDTSCLRGGDLDG